MGPQPKKNTALIGILAVVILGGLVVGTIALKPKDSFNTNSTSSNASSTADRTPASTTTTDSTNAFKDGTYTATGSYSSPGGNEEIDVTITVSGGTITDSSVAPQAASRESMEYQQDFAATYKDSVVGKALATLQLGKISGSSLTNRGFNDALDQIRSQAKS